MGKRPGLMHGVEKSVVEIFCNLDGATVAVGTFFLARFGFESVWFSWLFLEDFDTHFNKGLALSYKSLTCGSMYKGCVILIQKLALKKKFWSKIITNLGNSFWQFWSQSLWQDYGKDSSNQTANSHNNKGYLFIHCSKNWGSNSTQPSKKKIVQVFMIK